MFIFTSLSPIKKKVYLFGVDLLYSCTCFWGHCICFWGLYHDLVTVFLIIFEVTVIAFEVFIMMWCSANRQDRFLALSLPLSRPIPILSFLSFYFFSLSSTFVFCSSHSISYTISIFFFLFLSNPLLMLPRLVSIFYVSFYQVIHQLLFHFFILTKVIWAH